MESPNFIYALVSPDTGMCRYVGKARFPAKRLRDHLSRSAIMANTHKSRWLSSLVSRGLSPELVILEELPHGESWQQAECQWISYFKFMGASLTNATAGGDGVTGHSPEVLEKISLAGRGRKQSPEAIAKGIAAKTGQRRTPEVRAKMSRIQKALRERLALMGTPRRMSDSTRKKMSDKGKSKVFTEEHKANISKATKGRIMSPETRRAMSESRKGCVLSPEHKAKIGAAHLGQKRSVEQCENIRKGILANPHVYTDEVRRKMSESATGRKMSEETKKKKSDSMKKVHASKKAANPNHKAPSGWKNVTSAGESHRNAKLTAQIVLDIRQQHGTIPIKILAEKYGVTYSTVRMVVLRRTWGHI